MLLYGASVGQSAEDVPMTVTPGGDRRTARGWHAMMGRCTNGIG